MRTVNQKLDHYNVKALKVRQLLISQILAEKSVQEIVLFPIDELRPHEKGSPLYLELLTQEIVKDGVLKHPIIADERTNVILDGMHRWLALKTLGYTLIPVILVDAFQNPRVRVGRRRIHRYLDDPDKKMTIEKVISAGLAGRLMEPRSTRHFFSFSKFQLINCQLHLLKKGPAQDVSRYLTKTNGDEGRSAIKDWLEEISEELEFLIKRKEEVEKEKEEFLNRVKMLENSFSAF
jgi:hypothetical protein